VIARCRCGKTRSFRGHRHRFTCGECRETRRLEIEATAAAITCGGCGRTRRVPAKQVRKCEPCDGYRCGLFGCKQDPHWEPSRPIDKLIGWHLTTGQELDGGFYSYHFEQDTAEDLVACWRACEIRDAGLRQLRGDAEPA
jgi:hypothetical protein